jgi:hypothetical protein
MKCNLKVLLLHLNMDSKHKRLLLKTQPDVKKDLEIVSVKNIKKVKKVNPNSSPNPNHNYFSVLADY